MLFNQSDRKFHSKRAKAWTEGQAKRLGVSPEEILEAIRRGWLPEHVELIETSSQLQDEPAKWINLTGELVEPKPKRPPWSRPRSRRGNWKNEPTVFGEALEGAIDATSN